MRAAEDLFAEATEKLANAQRASAQQVEEAKARGEAEHKKILERARTELQELARQSAAAEQSSRQQLVVLEEHRRVVLEEIGLLHERLGSIGEGLAPVGRELRQASETSPHEPLPSTATKRSDDETAVLPMPSASGPNGRRAALSTR